MADFAPDTLRAAASIGSAIATLAALRWAAHAAEAEPGESLVSVVRLTLATLASVGRELERAHRALEGVPAGYFDETAEVTQ